MQPIRVGLCEDDTELRSVLSRALSAEGFQVSSTATGHEAVGRFSGDPPDLLVLDIGLPDADGRDVCQSLRAHGVDAPVIFLTARGSVADRLAGFGAGADDYLAKPFVLAELVFRLRALARRAAGHGGARTVGGLRLDPTTHALHAGEREVPLTPTEFRLLAALSARPSQVVRRRELIVAAWPDGAIVHDNTLDTYMRRLRRKLTELDVEEQITTVRGVGYSLR